MNPRVVLAETRGVEIEGLVDQMNLRLSLLGTSQKKAAEEIHDLKVSHDSINTILTQYQSEA